MARRKVAFFKGGHYHIYNRGANRQPIFRDDENYRFLLARVKEAAVEQQVSVLAYCLMPNHFHPLPMQRGRSLQIVPSEGLNSGADLFLEIPVRAGFDE